MSEKLIFHYGTMSSGKSLQVLTTAYNFQERNISFMIIKSVIDTRDGSVIKSRIGDGISRECIPVSSDDNIFDTVCQYIKRHNISWVLVDEVQFLSAEQIDQLSDVVDRLHINVWCFGLRTDFQTNLFPGSKRLFEIADKIEEIKSTCDCGNKNTVNVRIDKDGNIITSGSQVEVGGDDRYITVCRKCYKSLRYK